MDENKIPPVVYVDFDGTLAHFDTWLGPEQLGKPIPRMVRKVRMWLQRGIKVVIFTARLCVDAKIAPTKDREKVVRAIQAWCRLHIGQELEVTSDKGFFHKLYDDRAVSIVKNTGASREEALLELIDDLRKCYNNDKIVVDMLISNLKGLVERQDT